MVVVDPDDYPEVLAKLQSGDDSDNSFRRRLAWKAFQHASSYDSAVAEWLWKHQRDSGTLIGFHRSLVVSHEVRLQISSTLYWNILIVSQSEVHIQVSNKALSVSGPLY